MNLRSVLFIITAGIFCYLVNYTFLNFMITNYSWAWGAIFGKGSWWLNQPLYVRIPYVLLVAPIYEELIHRRLVMHFFVARGETELGLLISSATFALHHFIFGWGWLKAIDMFFVGLVFGAVYAEYRLAGSWLCHTANNGMAAVFMLA
ncbi:CPBP family intramembrane glutamic endopeptidase [Archaeoglobus veneficus]|nr:CPBP family intramembrane glutamic endopeptidase [Archaeoglobus veneficus]